MGDNSIHVHFDSDETVFEVRLEKEWVDGELFLVEYDMKNKTRAIIEKLDGKQWA